ncbi:MAG: SDR family oxidoreductase [Chloroflexi bacterium]|nr:SDR family oxidoreductase [Chloroflexota bacterium]
MAANKQNVLITGASSGIGFATALYLAEKGYSVIGTSRSKARLGGLEKQAAAKGLSVAGFELDINENDAVSEGVSQIVSSYGQIDALVNNAGYGLWGPLQSLSMDDFKAQFETNLFAVFRMTQAVLPGMLERRRGAVINISSVAGRVPTPFNSAYSASKFALEGMSESLRMELYPFGVRVAVVEPGLFKSRFHDGQGRDDSRLGSDSPYKEFIERYDRKHDRIMRIARDPIGVAKVVHKILKSRNPSFRHPVGTESWLGGIGARFVPERILEAMIRRSIM